MAMAIPTDLTLVFTLIFVVCCFCFHYFWSPKHRKISSSVPRKWPVFGMFPGLLRNSTRLHEYVTEILTETGGNFEFKGPWFSNIDMVFTCDPVDIHHVLTKNFSNYPKGPEFQKIFDILGDGIFNADSKLWEIHRKVALSVMHSADFQRFLEKSVLEKMEKGLFPVLENSVKRGAVIDLQDVFQRLTFDSISRLVLDYDPRSLSEDLPIIPCEKAFNDAVEALLWRHLLPEAFWKIQKWLKVGRERKLSQAWEAFDQFIFPCIERKQLQRSMTRTNPNEEEDHGNQFDGQTAFIDAYEAILETNSNSGITKLFLRNAFLNLMLAGRDTTSAALTWFFYLVAKHPSVEAKILREIEANRSNFQRCQNNQRTLFNVEESQKLVYLHAALSETLRLYPPVAVEHKSPMNPDILPSGVSVNSNSKVILLFYSTGRMESVWGTDCSEFKPERWISERGKIKHEPSYKFPAFNAGPRTCLGKEMAFVQTKMVAASIINSYKVKLVEDHPVSPSDSVVIQAKHGLKVMLSSRD